MDENTETAVVEYTPSRNLPMGRSEPATNYENGGLPVVFPIWLRHGLEHVKKRLLALEKKAAKENLILTESQVQALERKKHDDAVHERSKLSILAIWAPKTHFMLVR